MHVPHTLFIFNPSFQVTSWLFPNRNVSNIRPHGGRARKLVIAFDVGTTFSGVSYSILNPGEVPVIRGVNRFPGQPTVGGSSKIPTILYYDQQGNVRAAGDEANGEGIEQVAEEKEWSKAEWFKLHLRPKTQSTAHITEEIIPLPKGKTAIDVFADFLRYLYQCAQKYIEETHFHGIHLWKDLQPTSEFVLTHPNGWEGAQQGMMRQAAVMAGLIPAGAADQARLSFVTEGEASLHFCIHNGLTNDAINSGKGIVIVDAGGGTIDISAYKQKSTGGQAFEEIAAPQCFFKGSIFVTRNANDFLEKILQGSTYLDASDIARNFDKTTKLRFRDPQAAYYIKFGSLKDEDLRVGIRSGQILLNGSDVASFFEPSIQCIIQSIKDQQSASKTEISSVFLVGGFAASDWLFMKLNGDLTPHGLVVGRPDSHVNKAVADGAMSFYIDHYVTARVSKYAYGTSSSALYDENNPEHFSRTHKKYVDLPGDVMIGDLFSTILPMGHTVNETQEFRQLYSENATVRSSFESFVVDIVCYRGKKVIKAIDSFMDTDPKMFSTLCYVTADISHISSPPRIALNTGQVYYTVKFDVILSFGLTEFKAFIAWKENGIEKRSPAQVVYDPDTVIVDES